jgi:type I restriction enzyme S subunit
MVRKLDAAHSILLRTGVPDGWKDATLGDLVRIVGGGTPDRQQTAYWRSGTVPWITPTDLTANNTKRISRGAENISEQGLENCNATLVPQGSLIFSTRGTVGNIAAAANPLTCNQSCEVLVPRQGVVDGDFLYYLLNFGMSAFMRLSGGTTFGAITRGDIIRVHFAVPETTSEQAAIARVLDGVEAAIEAARQSISASRDLAASLILRAMERQGAPARRLRDFITDVRYGTSQASNERGWGHPTLRIPNVVGDQLSLTDVTFVDLRPADVERLILHDGDLLLVRTNGNPNYVGRSAVFRVPDQRVWVYASYLIRVRLKDGLLPEYVNIFLSTERGRRELLRRVTTSAGNHNINSNSIRLLSLPVPASKADQDEVIEIAAAVRARTAALITKEKALQDLKSALMYDLLTGRVRMNTHLESVGAA